MTDLLRILAGPLLWLATFSAVYGLHGILCGIDPAGTAFGEVSLPRILLAAAWLVAIALQLAVVAALHSARFGSRSNFVRVVSRTTGWVGLAASLWTLFPTVVTSSCL